MIVERQAVNGAGGDLRLVDRRPDLPRLLNIEGLALELWPTDDREQLRLHVKRLHRWRSSLSLPAYVVGRSLYFDPETVRAWLESQRVGEWPT